MARGTIPFACTSITIDPTRLAYASACRRISVCRGIRSPKAPSELLVNGNLLTSCGLPIEICVQYTRIEVNGYTDTSGTPKNSQAQDCPVALA
jgi:hypothetical protein